MIVFTITNTITDQIYVGTSREDLDRRWEVILKAAESGVEAHLYDDIREHGVDGFAISEWAFAEDTEELRELMQAALEETGGVSLQGLKLKAPKAPRVSKPKAPVEDFSRDALLSLEEQDSELPEEVFASEQQDDEPDKKSPDATDTSEAKVELADEPLTPAQLAARRKADKAAYDARQDAIIKARMAKEKAAAREMALLIARMDARGKKPKKPAAKKATVKTAAKSTAKAAAKSTASANRVSFGDKPEALPSGRVSSATKEKKIRDAIALEKDARQEEKIARQKAEAAEMAALIARLDERARPKKAAKKTAAKKTVAKKPVAEKSVVKPETVKSAALEQHNALSAEPVDTVITSAKETRPKQDSEVVAAAIAAFPAASAAESKSGCFTANGKQVVISKRKTLTLKRRQKVVEARQSESSVVSEPAEKPAVETFSEQIADSAVAEKRSSLVSVTATEAVSPVRPQEVQVASVVASVSEQTAVAPQPLTEQKQPSAAEQKLMEQLANQDAETTEMAKLIAKVAARKASLQKRQPEAAANTSANALLNASQNKEQRMRQLIAEEKAKRQASKNTASGNQTEKMAMIMARLEEQRAKCRR